MQVYILNFKDVWFHKLNNYYLLSEDPWRLIRIMFWRIGGIYMQMQEEKTEAKLEFYFRRIRGYSSSNY